MKKAIIFWITLCLMISPQILYSQQFNLDFYKDKMGIVVLKLSLCDIGNDEYCLVAQDIYFNKKRHTIAEYHLLKEIDSFYYRTNPKWKFFHHRILEDTGNHHFLHSKYFAQTILAQSEQWIRGTGGEVFVLKEKGKYYVKDFFIVYKVKGNFALISESFDRSSGSYFHKKLKSKKLNFIFFPLAEVLKIQSFSKISRNEIRMLGLRRFHLPYYRINTAYEPELFLHAGEGSIDE